MSNDKTTLADVQPGGRVRLGDQAERARFEAWVAPRRAIHGFNRCEDMWDAWQAALSAKPSPGGQDVLFIEELAELRRLVPSVNQKKALDAAIAALAARQPVGGPVAWKYRAPGVSFWRVSFRKPVNPEWECEPLYAAPAQAVDLGQIWQQAFDDTAHSYRRNKSRMWVLQMMKERVQALINSQAVGNG